MDNCQQEKNKVQQELLESQERYRVLVETIPDIIYELDTEGKFVFVSEAVEMLGYKPQELMGKHFSEIIHPDDIAKVSRETVLLQYKGKVTGDEEAPKLFDERRTGKRATKNLEVRLLHKNKRSTPEDYFYGEVHSSGNWQEVGQQKRFVGSIGIIRDITKRKIVEKILTRAKEELEMQTLELRKANDNIKKLYRELENKNKELQALDKLKSDFLSMVSHELRTPLTTIREGVSQVLDGALGPISQQQREFLSISLDDIERLERIINELLDISKIESGKLDLKLEYVDLVGLVKNICIIFGTQAQKKNLALRQNFSKENIGIFIDKDMISQVLTNLVGNAIKFTQEGYVEISIEDKDDFVECSVKDTGCGIAEENLPKIFEKFQQFSRVAGPGEKGTGLGLSIVKGIIDIHRGKLFVESKLNCGSKFSFILPKITLKEVMEDYIAKGLEEASSYNSSFSIINFGVNNFEALLKTIGPEKCNFVLGNLEQLVRLYLRKKSDLVIRENHPLFIILPLTEKTVAIKIMQRILSNFNNFLLTNRLNTLVSIYSKVFSFPQDCKTKDEFLNFLEIR